MSIAEFLIIIGVFISLLFLYRSAGKWIKKMDPKKVKLINWTGFSVAALSGIAWYIFHDPAFMFITLAGVVAYFLFYDYNREEGTEAHAGKGENKNA